MSQWDYKIDQPMRGPFPQFKKRPWDRGWLQGQNFF